MTKNELTTEQVMEIVRDKIAMVNIALMNEIEELTTYGMLLPDRRAEIDAEIRGIQTARRYLSRLVGGA